MTACPVCGGKHLYGITFQHRTECRLYTADTQTRMADAERGHGIRPATPAEIEMAAALGVVNIEFEHSAGIHRRRIITTENKEI